MTFQSVRVSVCIVRNTLETQLARYAEMEDMRDRTLPEAEIPAAISFEKVKR
jgi:hypothetical protein